MANPAPIRKDGYSVGIPLTLKVEATIQATDLRNGSYHQGRRIYLPAKIATRYHVRVYITISVGNYDFGRIGKCDAAVIAPVMLNAYRKQAFRIDLLPSLHFIIKPSHRRALKVKKIMLVRI